MGRVTKQNVANVMTYHAPTEGSKEKHNIIEAAAIVFANVIFETTPECADQTAAIRAIREARMWANAAIALGGQV